MNIFKLLPRVAPLAIALGVTTLADDARAAVSWQTCVVDDVRVYADGKAIYRCVGSATNYYLFPSASEAGCAGQGLAMPAENYRAAISMLQSSLLTGRQVSIAWESKSQCYSVRATNSLALL